MAKLMSPLLRSRASIFMLHRFRSPDVGLDGHDPKFIRLCLEELRRRRATILSLDQLVARALAGGSIDGAVAFTMDDGFWDQGEIGAELFLEYDIPVTCFLITGLQDGALWPWDDRLAFIYETSPRKHLSTIIGGQALEHDLASPASRRKSLRATRALMKKMPFSEIEPILDDLAQCAEVAVQQHPPERFRPIGWDLARRLEQRGVRFGPHTASHGIVSRMTDEEAKHELLSARDRLAEELARPLDIYGWPTGRHEDFCGRDVAILREAGIKAAVATDESYAVFSTNPGHDHLFRLQRFGLPDNRIDFLQACSWIERGKQILRGR